MVNVFSFCLYGAYNPRYYDGMIQNIELAQRYFPDWKVYIYIAPDIESWFISLLRQYSNIVLFETGITGQKNMIHRFFAIDEVGVELMMVRDADSRIHWKDRWAIRDFLDRKQYVAHTIRDHIDHTAYLLGGLWGLRKSSGLSIRTLYSTYIENTSLGHRLAHDQNFLMDVVYPLVKSNLLVHYSHAILFQGEYGIVFPFEWTGDIFCGKIETNFIDRPEPKKGVLQLPNVAVRVKDFSTPIEVTTSVPTSEPSYKMTPTSNILNFLYKK